MFTSAIGRLIWKEYRVQRALWFLLLGLLVVLQILLRIAFFTTAGSESPYGTSIDEAWATWAMWVLAFIAQVIFLIASIAIGFAGEREERTCDLLVHHAPSPWAVLLAKVGTCIAGSVALYLCGAFVAMSLGRSSPNDLFMTYQIFYMHPSIGTDLLVRVVVVLVLLTWCLFGSLLSQRVLTSIPTMAVGWVITGWIPLLSAAAFLSAVTPDVGPQIDRSILLSAFVLVALVMLAVDAWLGYRWAEGKYFDLNFLAEYGGFWTITWSGLWESKSRRSHIPRGIEPDEIERRPWKRLVWQERRRGSIPRWMTIGICALILIASPSHSASPDIYGSPSAQDFTVCLLGLAMGILSFRSDGEGQPVRFLVNHGASAGMIWRAKQAVWMVRAFLIPVVLLALVAIRDSVLSSYPPGLIQRQLWLILVSYGCGQMAAMLLRRAILAAITGGTVVAILFLWFELMRNLQLPQWWSLGLPTIAPLLATRMHAKSWLLDGSTWSHKVRLSAILIGLPLLTFATVAAYRVLEVEMRQIRLPGGQWPSLHEQGNLTVAVSSRELSARPRLLAIAAIPAERTPLSKSDSTNLLLTEHEQKRADEVADLFSTNSTLIHESFVQTVELAVDDDTIDLRARKVLDAGERRLFPVRSFERLSDLLLARVRDHLQLDEPDPAYEVCLAHLNLCRAMARGPFKPCWQAGAEQERRVLELLVEWANHGQVTFAAIHGAIKELEARQRYFPTPSSAIIDELAEAKRQSIINEYTQLHGSIVGWQRIWLQLPWETARRHRLWEMEAQLHGANLSYLAYRNSYPPELAPSATWGSRSWADENAVPVGGDYLKPLTDLQASTWGSEVALAHDRSEHVRDRFTADKAARTRMGIIAYRKQYGKMPADLDALYGIVRQSDFQDPWSSGRFDYRSNCLVSQGNGQSLIDTDLPVTQGATKLPPKASRFVFPIPAAIVEPNSGPSNPSGNKTR